MACLPQPSSVPAAYAVVAGGCDWPIHDVISLTSLTSVPLRPLRSLRYVRCMPYVALDETPLQMKCVKMKNIFFYF